MEKTEMFRVRKYFEKMGTNIYARGVKNYEYISQLKASSFVFIRHVKRSSASVLRIFL